LPAGLQGPSRSPAPPANRPQAHLIGHRGHPEIEGTLGHVAAGSAFIVNSAADVAALPLTDDEPTAYAVQTTYSVNDARDIVEALVARFSDLAGPSSSDICYATTIARPRFARSPRAPMR
jgi:4-hydroxy-3-methylbut-2-enyl diphosphate reductase IspH